MYSAHAPALWDTGGFQRTESVMPQSRGATNGQTGLFGQASGGSAFGFHRYLRSQRASSNSGLVHRFTVCGWNRECAGIGGFDPVDVLLELIANGSVHDDAVVANVGSIANPCGSLRVWY